MDLNYNINTKFDPTGSNQAMQATDRLLESTKGQGTAAADLADTQKNLAQKTEDVGNKTEDAAGKVKLFQGEAHEVKKVIGEVTRISPLLGEALRLAMNPVSGTIVAAIGLFGLMKEHIAEVNRELNEMGEKAADPTFLEGIRAKSEILREAAEAAAEYTTHIDYLIAGEQGVIDKLTAQLALLQAINAARGEHSKTDGNLEQAKIRGALASGQITPEQAAEQTAIANAKAITNEANQKNSAKHDEVVAKITALETAENQQPELKANADALTATYSAEAGRRAKNAKDFGGDDFNKKIADAQAEGESARKALESQYGDTATKRILSGQEPGASTWAKMQAGKISDSEETVRSLNAGRTLFNRDQATEGQFNELGRQAGDARQKTDSNATTIGSLSEELKRITDAILATRGIDAATTKNRVSTVTADLGSELAHQNTSAIQREKTAVHGGDPKEISSAVSEAQAHGRALVAAAKEAHGSSKEVYAAIMAALNAFREEQTRMAQQISRVSYKADLH